MAVAFSSDKVSVLSIVGEKATVEKFTAEVSAECFKAGGYKASRLVADAEAAQIWLFPFRGVIEHFEARACRALPKCMRKVLSQTPIGKAQKRGRKPQNRATLERQRK